MHSAHSLYRPAEVLFLRLKLECLKDLAFIFCSQYLGIVLISQQTRLLRCIIVFPLTSMFGRWLPFRKSKYVSINSSDRKDYEEDSQSSYGRLELRVVEAPFDLSTIFLVCLIIIISAGSLGFLAGRRLPPLIPSDFLPGNIIELSNCIMSC